LVHRRAEPSRVSVLAYRENVRAFSERQTRLFLCSDAAAWSKVRFRLRNRDDSEPVRFVIWQTAR